MTPSLTQFDRNIVVPDFNFTPLNVEELKNLGIKSHILEYVSKGIPAQFDYLLKCPGLKLITI